MRPIARGSDAIAVGRAAYRHFREDGCENHAAGIAFFALLSLVPLLALALLGIGILFGRTSPEDARWLSHVFQEVGELRPEVLATLQKLAELRGADAVPLVITMAASGSLVFGALERTFLRVFARSRRRGYWRARLRSLLVMILSALSLVILFGSHQLIRTMSDSSLRLGLLWPDSPASVLLSWTVGLALEVVVFFLLLRFLTGGVGSHAALLAAVLTTGGWELFKVGFGIYAVRAWTHGVIYGPLETLIMVSLWLYLSALNLLFGAEVAAVLNGDRPI